VVVVGVITVPTGMGIVDRTTKDSQRLKFVRNIKTAISKLFTPVTIALFFNYLWKKRWKTW
jgi:hypothetical protein